MGLIVLNASLAMLLDRDRRERHCFLFDGLEIAIRKNPGEFRNVKHVQR